jgi:hypothetical protein
LGVHVNFHLLLRAFKGGEKVINPENDSLSSGEGEMPKEQRKRIYNPWTETYYSVRQRSSARGKAGTIKGKWEPPKKHKR